jgi:hypothetical protein
MDEKNNIEISDAELIESYDPDKFRETIRFETNKAELIIRPVTADEMQRIREGHNIQKWNSAKRKMEFVLSEAGEIEFLTLALKDWKNVTWEIVNEWLRGSKQKFNRTGEIKFNIKTARALCKKVPFLDQLITSRATGLQNLTEKAEEVQTENFLPTSDNSNSSPINLAIVKSSS